MQLPGKDARRLVVPFAINDTARKPHSFTSWSRRITLSLWRNWPPHPAGPVDTHQPLRRLGQQSATGSAAYR